LALVLRAGVRTGAISEDVPRAEDLAILEVLITMADHTNHWGEAARFLRETYKKLIFNTEIHRGMSPTGAKHRCCKGQRLEELSKELQSDAEDSKSAKWRTSQG
jgi:hypothetical protein